MDSSKTQIYKTNQKRESNKDWIFFRINVSLPSWVLWERSISLRDLRTLERTIRFCLKMGSNSEAAASMELLVLVELILTKEWKVEGNSDGDTAAGRTLRMWKWLGGSGDANVHKWWEEKDRDSERERERVISLFSCLGLRVEESLRIVFIFFSKFGASHLSHLCWPAGCCAL